MDRSGLANKSRYCVRLLVCQSRGLRRTHADVVEKVRPLKHLYTVMSAVKRELLFTAQC